MTENTEYYLNFWRELGESSPDMDKLIEFGIKIIKMNNLIAKDFSFQSSYIFDKK